MKCHFCKMDAIATLEIAHRYYIPMCILHEDTVYHDIEMCIVEKIREVFHELQIDNDDDFHRIQGVVDEVIQHIPFASQEQCNAHQAEMRRQQRRVDEADAQSE